MEWEDEGPGMFEMGGFVGRIGDWLACRIGGPQDPIWQPL